MSNSSIWPIDRTLSGATSPCPSEPRSNGNEVILNIPQTSRITEALSSDSLASYIGHAWWESYSTAEMQSVYSAPQADWARRNDISNHFRKRQWYTAILLLSSIKHFSIFTPSITIWSWKISVWFYLGNSLCVFYMCCHLYEHCIDKIINAL